jgi:hypothetical protein
MTEALIPDSPIYFPTNDDMLDIFRSQTAKKDDRTVLFDALQKGVNYRMAVIREDGQTWDKYTVFCAANLSDLHETLDFFSEEQRRNNGTC